MAFLYDAGLRLRAPEPMPECVAGESPQDYFSRVLAEVAIESATTAENTSGDSAPTPFNLGQVQSDIEQAQQDITALQTSDTEQDTAIEDLTGGIATGITNYASADTTAVISFPEDGVWRIGMIMPLEQEITGVFVTGISSSQATINFDSPGSAGSFHWTAFRVS